MFSRDYPFSLLSPKIAKNNSFRRKAHCFGGVLNATDHIASHLIDELALLLQRDKAEIDSYAQLRVNQYKSMFELTPLFFDSQSCQSNGSINPSRMVARQSDGSSHPHPSKHNSRKRKLFDRSASHRSIFTAEPNNRLRSPPILC